MSSIVTLEPIAPRHAESVQKLASHPEVVATTNLPDPYPEDGAEQWIQDAQCRRNAGIEYPFAILNQEETLVGVTGLVEVSGGVAELGYWIGKPFWGNGYATAANGQILHFAFETLELCRVFARPLQKNPASCRVLEKVNFAAQRVETYDGPKWNGSATVVRYVLTREEWMKRAVKVSS